MSIISKNDLEKNKVEIVYKVDSEPFKEAVRKVFLKESKGIALPGFRKGKAPKHLIEKMFGKAIFFEDAINNVSNASLPDIEKEIGRDILKVEKFDLVDDIEEIDENEGFSFKIVSVVSPLAEIKDYLGIEVPKFNTDVTDEEVEKELLAVRERNSRMITVEDRPVQNGDTVIIDYKGLLEGEAFEGGTAENSELEIGSKTFIPGFEEQIIGHNTDDEFSINVTFPENYGSEEVAGKDVVFEIKLHEIKFKELPELDDDFAIDVSETANTLDEYKEELKQDLINAKKARAEQEKESHIMDTLAHSCECEIPDILLENEISRLIDVSEGRFNSMGLTLEQYLSYTGMTMEQFRESLKPRAVLEIKFRLALDKIAELENIAVTEEDVEKEIENEAELVHVSAEYIKSIVPRESFIEDAKRMKALDLVSENAVEVDMPEFVSEAENETEDETENPENEAAKSNETAEDIEPLEAEAPADENKEEE